MTRFQVTISEMKAAIIELLEKNEMFKSKIRELEAAQQALSVQWQGDANVAFSTAFENDKEKWMEFSKLIDQYIQVLVSIMQAYEKAEEANVSRAKEQETDFAWDELDLDILKIWSHGLLPMGPELHIELSSDDLWRNRD